VPYQQSCTAHRRLYLCPLLYRSSCPGPVSPEEQSHGDGDTPVSLENTVQLKFVSLTTPGTKSGTTQDFPAVVVLHTHHPSSSRDGRDKTQSLLLQSWQCLPPKCQETASALTGWGFTALACLFHCAAGSSTAYPPHSTYITKHRYTLINNYTGKQNT